MQLGEQKSMKLQYQPDEYRIRYEYTLFMGRIFIRCWSSSKTLEMLKVIGKQMQEKNL